MIVKSNISKDDIQRIELNELQALSIRVKRAMMYNLDYAVYKYEEEETMYFEALTLKPKYLRFIQSKEVVYGPASMWSKELIDKLDNEFMKKYMF